MKKQLFSKARKHTIMRLSTLAMVLVILCTAYPARAFETEIVGINLPLHQYITYQGLSFLNSDIQIKLADEHVDVEIAHIFDGFWHFDGCQFQATTNLINTQYANAVQNMDPSDPDVDAVVETFGQILHPVQDFYSHSNWVEMRQANLINQRLVDDGEEFWDLLTPFYEKKVQGNEGFIIVEESFGNIPTGYSLQKNGSIVTVSAPQGNRPGLITGTFSGSDNCPQDAQMTHDELNKDKPWYGWQPSIS